MGENLGNLKVRSRGVILWLDLSCVLVHSGCFDKQTVCGQEWKQKNPDIMKQMTDGMLGVGFGIEDAEK